MKQVIRLLLVLAIVIIAIDRLLGLGFDYMYRNNRVGESGGKINAYLSLPETPYLTIFGTSRIKFQLIPDSIPVSFFNLAHNGMHMPFQTGLVSIVAEHKKLGKTVIVLVEPWQFQYDKVDHNTNLDIQNLRYFYGKNKLVTQYINEMSEFEPIKYFFQLYRFNGRAVNLFSHFTRTRKGETVKNGWEEMPQTPRDSSNTIKHALTMEHKNFGGSLSKNSVRHLDDIVTICKASKVNLVLITTPYFYETKGKFDVGHKFLDNYAAKHNLPYIDYSRNRLPGLESPKLWKDSEHPNSIAGRIITHDLMKRLKALGLIPTEPASRI